MFTTLNSKLKRMLSVVLALSMVLSPIMALAEEVGGAVATALEEPLAVVFAAADFQPRRMETDNGNVTYPDDRMIQYGVTAMENIADAVLVDYPNITGAFFGGDYSNESKYRKDYGYSNNANITIDGINAVRYVYGSKFGLSDEEMVMIQGNHDIYLSPLATTGAHDTEEYGVYAINEKDFPYLQATLANAKDTVKKTAEELDRYLQAKVAQHYSKPIFIVNHIPLHHNPRVEDNVYSELLFDIINKAGEQGLKIFFLFGHNHSAGYDAHIGEAAIYLKPGEDIYIPDSSTYDETSNSSYSQKRKLNFAYVNAGYVGHVRTSSEGYTDNTLTGTVFAIYENRVEVKRYDADGEHVLKAAGKALTTFENHHLYLYDQSTGSDTVYLNDRFNVSLNIDNLFPRTTVTSKQVTGITIAEGTNGSGDYSTSSSGKKITTVTTSDKELDLPKAENFKVGVTRTIGIDYVAEQYRIKSVVSSKPDVATADLENGEVTVTGVAPGKTTLTIVAEHVGGVYADVSLTYDLVVFPASTTPLYYTRYELINAHDVKLNNTYVVNSTFATTTFDFEKGESYVFVNTHQNTKAWGYAFLNAPSGETTATTRNVAVYGTYNAETYKGTFVDISDEYMEWIYCPGGYFRNSATGLYITSRIDTTSGAFGLVNVCPRDVDGDGPSNDFNKWNIGNYGIYIDDADNTTGNGYRRYMRYDSADKRFETELTTNNDANNGRKEQYSNVSIYKKVQFGNNSTGESAWVDTSYISAFEDDLDGVTGATMYVADGMSVTAVPVTLNMLTSNTEIVTNDTAPNTAVSDDFSVLYNDIKVASGVTLTLRSKPTWTTRAPNQTINVGKTCSITSSVDMPGATNITYTYESLNVACATVSSDGTVTGTGVGGANIRVTATATYSDGSTLSTTDEVYVTVNPSDTCYKVVRKFGKNDVYTLIQPNELACDDYKDTTDSAESFMIVSSNEAGDAFAMQNYAGVMTNLNAKGVNIESHNGVKFIQNFDNSILWQMVQKGAYCTESTVLGGSVSASGGWRLPNEYYYQVDSMKASGLEFLIALQNMNNDEYDGSLTMDFGTNLFCSEGGNSYIGGTITDTYPTRNGIATMYKEPAAAWNYNQPSVGLAGINYYPSGDSSYFSKKGGHFTYVMTYDENLGQFKAVFHDGVWPSGIQDQCDSTGDYPGRVYLYAKRNIETSGVIIWISNKNEGTVGYNATNGTVTGAMINVTTHGPDGVTTVSEPLTYGMLSKDGMTTAVTEDTTYEGVTVKYTYNGTEYTICNKFKLNVVNMDEDYPDYPDQGSVNINKVLDTSKYNYKGTGVSHIDLTVSGIPLTSGIDIVVMVDASTSMQDAVGGNEITRLQMLYEALVELMNALKTPDENGKYSDVDVAIASFNGQTYLNKNHLISPLQTLCTCANCVNDGVSYHHYNSIDMSTVNLPFANVTDSSYDAFIDSLEYDIEKSTFEENGCNVKTIVPSSGTNYDKAMDLTYDLLTAKQAQNTARGENREQFVIFMTDGETWQYNYFGGTNKNKGYSGHPKVPYHDADHISKWLYVLDGRLDTDNKKLGDNYDFANTPWNEKTGDTTPVVLEPYQDIFKEYYNPEGKHWMAEAIKGDPAEKYMIIDPDSKNADKIEYVNGVGATMYTIAFTIGEVPNRGLKRDIIEGVVERMATSPEHFTSIDTDTSAYDNLVDAFMKIKDEIKTAGNAMFVDQMGDDFNLQVKTDFTVDGTPYHLDTEPSITLTSYPLYKYWEVGTVVDGVAVSQDMVGKRKSNAGTLIEEITFLSNGAQANSTLLGTTNILGSDGIIRGKNVWYNTNTTAYTLTDEDKANAPALAEKEITVLQPETFYWMIGDIPEDEYVLGYDVYLEGSMEGTAIAGQHDTNNFATLSYVNHLEHNCSISVPTPKLPWDKAYVGVGFYFVNDKGQPLVNRKTGQTGSFEAAQKLDDIQYYEFPLNNTEDVTASKAITASDVLPGGYELFDESAAYEVFAASSNEIAQKWTITKGVDLATTYVTQFGSSATSSNKLEETSKDITYTNTIVYFAIKGTVNAVPDTFVIDYAIPVKLNVMANDVLFAGEAELRAICNATDLPVIESSDEKAERLNIDDKYLYVEGTRGDAQNSDGQVTKDNDTYGQLLVLDTEYIKYTPRKRDVATTGKMEFNAKETFQYAAYYSGEQGVNGYYYANVYVIPATSIYYEETFATFKVYDIEAEAYTADPYADPTGGQGHSYWKQDTSSIGLTQTEDRPGKLSQNDANNIYGYDPAYSTYQNWSYGTYKSIELKPTKTDPVTGEKIGTYEGEVSFTFYGTGFDVIAASSENSGPILVMVHSVDSSGNVSAAPVKSQFVDTFYGYAYNEETGEWEVNWDKDELYQIPVIKFSGLTYGRYKVFITTSYSEFFDHTNNTGNALRGKHRFYFDGIRIYDPIRPTTSDTIVKNAYIADNEGWPVYHEVRNLLISAEKFNNLGDSSVNGLVFIDGKPSYGGDGEGEDFNVTDYVNYGPNNEVYLMSGQAIAFDLGTNDATSLRIAMKKTRSAAINVRMYNAVKGTDGKITIKNEIVLNEINHSAELYYDISKLNGGTVVIENTSTNTSLDAILSVTNLKFTYASKADSDAAKAEGVPKVTNQTGMVAAAAMKKVAMPWLDVKVEETSAFVPEMFDVALSKTTVKEGGLITVTVKTSADVDYITVNGIEVTRFTKSWFTAERQWKYTVRATEAGDMPIEVVAYNTDGEASEAAVNTVTVTKKLSLGSNSSSVIFDRIFGGWYGSFFAKAN